MSAARDQMLTRIRQANQVAAGAPPPPLVRDYRAGGDVPAGHPGLVDQLEERLVDYRATVVRASGSVAGEVANVVARLIEVRGAGLLTARATGAAPELEPRHPR